MNVRFENYSAPMPRPRAHLDAAALADAFAADGLHGTSSSAPARALGLAKPMLYVHGTSKEALFLRAGGGGRARAGPPARRGGGGHRAHCTRPDDAAALALLEHAADRPGGARLLARTARHETSEVAEAVAAALRRIPDRIEAGLRRDLAADGLAPALAPCLARAVEGAAWAMSELCPGERRPARAALAAAPMPLPASLPAASWPAA